MESERQVEMSLRIELLGSVFKVISNENVHRHLQQR